MYNRLHDGPTHLPTGSLTYLASPTTKPRASLAALQWAADRAGMSYGTFTLHLSPADEARIQEEYEAYKAERDAAAAARRAQRVENELPTPEGFIISDDDV